jgi:putative membrane protein
MTYPTAKNENLLKLLDRVAVLITIVVLALVGVMRRVKIPTEIDFSFLPPIHATVNALAAVALIFALVFIKRKQVELHQKSIYAAFVFSGLFLLSYVLYHFTTEETKFCKEGMIRQVYFVLLISHIILAGLILPFILMAFNRAYTGFYERHKKMVKWVYPIWLYVAISGPICYLMLRPCY